MLDEQQVIAAGQFWAAGPFADDDEA